MINIENRDPEWLARATEYLMSFMTPERVDNFRRVLAKRTQYISLLTENTFHTQNSSALIRHCDAFGVMDIHAVENLCRFTAHHDIVRGSDKWINLHRYDTSREGITALKSAGYRIVVTSPYMGGSTPESFDVEAGAFALVFGEEKNGVSQDAVELADEFIQIPMCGMVESLNVSASAAILIYQLTERVRASKNIDWHLPEQQQQKALFEWCFKSVRSADKILENL